MAQHSFMSQRSTFSGHSGHFAEDHRLVSRDERMSLFSAGDQRKLQLLT